MTEFEAYLNSFREQGKACGEGGFTWELERSLTLLSKYQLPTDWHYVLRFVASAVACGASRFEAKTLRAGYRFCWNGPSLTRDDLESLLPSVLGDCPRLSELAIGLASANRLYADIELRSGDSVLRFCQRELRLELATEVTSGVVLFVRKLRKRSLFQRLLKKREMALVKSHCSFANLDWSLPRSKFTRPNFIEPSLRFGAPPSASGSILLSLASESEKGCGYFVLQSKSSDAVLVKHGVQYPFKLGLSDLPGQLVWWHDDIRLDLSRATIVENQDFENWRTWLVEKLHVAFLKAVELHSGHYELEPLKEWLDWSEQEANLQESVSGTLALGFFHSSMANLESQRYQQALEEIKRAVELDQYYLSWEAVCTAMAGDSEAALPIYERAIELCPEDDIVRANYAEDLDNCGRREEALVAVGIALKLNPNSGFATALKAKLLAETKPEIALEYAENALEMAACPASVWETLAGIHQQMGEPEAQVTCLARFIELAKPETLWENNLPERLSTARERLASLKKSLAE